MRSLRIFLSIVLFCIIVVLSVAVAADNTVEAFRSSLRSSNITLMKPIIHPRGLLLIRLYNQSNPHRKTDIITKITEFPVEFKIPVSDDFPFDLPYLFGGSVRNKSLVYLNEMPGEVRMNENSIPSIRTFARHILSFVNSKTRSFTPTVVYTKEGYLVLAEGEISDGMLSGSMAVFQKSGGQYLLRMIIDLK